MQYVARGEVIPVSTLTLTDEQFLTGDANGKASTIAGVLRVPSVDTGRLPAVILVHGSGGPGGNIDYWQQQLNALGIATFALDVFSGRGITRTIEDQTQLGRLNGILDAYRALEIVAGRPWIDAERVVLMGFSRGGQVALYAALKRFQKMWRAGSHDFLAYIAFYASCFTQYIGDTDVAGKPIRLFHGSDDDYVPVGPTRSYVERLRAAGKDVELAEYAGAHHAFDNPRYERTILMDKAQTTRNCRMIEESPGRILNAATGRPFTMSDACVELGTHVGFHAVATAAATDSVTSFLRSAFSMSPGGA